MTSGEATSGEGKIPLRMVVTLAIAGLGSGLAIVLAYVWTLPMIEANRAEALRRAVFKVVPGATAMQKLIVRDGKLVIDVPNPDGPPSNTPGVYAAYTDGAFTGYAIPSQGAGFQDTIRLIYGYDPKREVVVGMEILESKETPGLGDKIFKDAKFQENFIALKVKPEVLCVKNGKKTQDNEVDGISGATISSKAVAKIIQAGNESWMGAMPASGKEPAYVAPVPKEEK